VLQVATESAQQASDESVSWVPYPGHFSSSSIYLLDPSGLGDTTATACLTLRITRTATGKPLHHGRLEMQLKKKQVKVSIWSIALCDAEAWALRKSDE